MLACTFAFILLGGFVAVPAQQNAGMDLETRRQVEALTEQIRILHSEGRFEDVIRTADQLLAIDPDNTAAELWSSRARRRLEGEPVVIDRLIELREPTTRARPTPAPAFEATELLQDIAPVPLEPRERPSAITAPGGLTNWMLGVLVAVAVLLIVVAVIAVVRMRKSQQAAAMRLSEAVTQHGGAGGAKSPSMYDAVTQVGGENQPARDENSVMQFGSVGRTNDDDTHPHGQTPAPPPIVAKKQEQETEVDEEEPLLDPQDIPTAPNLDAESIDLGIDFSSPQKDEEEEKKESSFNSLLFTAEGDDDDTSAPPAAERQKPPTEPPATEQEDDDLTFNSLMFAGDADETQVPGGEKTGQSAKSPPPPTEQDEDLTFNSLMFAGDADETSVPGGEKTGAQPPKKDGPASEDDADLTFNSLMFGESEETQLPGSGTTKIPGEPPKEKKGADDEGDLTFNSMMFGGDETALPDPETKVGADEPDLESDTLNIGPGLFDDPEATNVLGGAQASGAERFEHQKQVGLQAMEAGDYQLAVQSFQLAQAIQPDDAEVAEKLSEAKRLRDEG